MSPVYLQTPAARAPRPASRGAALSPARAFDAQTGAPARAAAPGPVAGHEFSRVAVSDPAGPTGAGGGVIQRKGPKYVDPVVNTIRQPRARRNTSGRRTPGPRKAKWLRELEAQQAARARERATRPDREEARRQEFLSDDSIDWMQHIDLPHISQGRDAYDRNRDDALDPNASFMGNMASSRAFIETALQGGDELNFDLYDRLHTRTMTGARNEGASRLHPVEDGAYGFQAGRGGRINPRVLAQAMRGADNPFPSVDGMRATQQLSPLYEYGNVALDPAYQLNEPERVAYVQGKQESGELDAGAFMEFPYAHEDRLRARLEGNFSQYRRAAGQARSAGTTTERHDQARLAVATLHQQLERSHAYADGNGRTNLALMNALLLKEGMSPAILDDPSSSHLVTAEEWAEQIRKGQDRHDAVKATWDRHRNKAPEERTRRVSNVLRDFDRQRGTEALFRFKDAAA